MCHPERIPDVELTGLITDFEQCPMFAALATGTARLHRLDPLESVHCPVHITWGACDRVIPYRRFGEPFPRLVPGAQFSALPGVGHVPMYDDPQLVARTILELTTQVDELDRPEHRGAAS
jgi:pimeloyl-ACP methyl ester carboxylesterase